MGWARTSGGVGRWSGGDCCSRASAAVVYLHLLELSLSGRYEAVENGGKNRIPSCWVVLRILVRMGSCRDQDKIKRRLSIVRGYRIIIGPAVSGQCTRVVSM